MGNLWVKTRAQPYFYYMTSIRNYHSGFLYTLGRGARELLLAFIQLSMN